jgi:hypothetical protein
MNWATPAIFSLLTTTAVFGASEADVRVSRSIGYNQEHQTALSLDSSSTNKHPELIKEGYRHETAAVNRTLNTTSLRHSNCNCNPQDFSISKANVSLHSDSDFDGYYRGIQLSFDANVYSGRTQVYAEIYLSFEGGPWNHLYTTDRFNLAGNTRLDEYVVETELDSGYPTGYYDILIELYAARSGLFLLDYGPYDNRELSALPLEDWHHDSINGGDNSYGFYGSGGIGWIDLFIAGLLLRLRQFVQPRIRVEITG